MHVLGLRSFNINTPGLKCLASTTLFFSCSPDVTKASNVADRGLRFDKAGLLACALLLLTSLEDFGSPVEALCLFIRGEFLGECLGECLGDVFGEDLGDSR